MKAKAIPYRQQLRRNFISTLLCVFVLAAFPAALQAQSDSLRLFVPPPVPVAGNNFLSVKKDSDAAKNLHIKISPTPDADFSELAFALFPGFDQRALEAWQFLVGMPRNRQQALIVAFSKYEDLFDTELKQAGLPPEIKYLPAALSLMNTDAIGANREAGIWQLSHFQGVLNGLAIDRLVDERFQPERATQAAAGQLAKNREIFNDNELALLGFIAGNSCLQNARALSGADCSTADLLKKLPESTQNTLALWKALAVFFAQNPMQHSNEIMETDTVWIEREIHFQQIAQVIGISAEHIRELNPQYRFSIVPAGESRSALLLPRGKKDDFLMMWDSVFNAYDSALFAVVAPKIEYPPAPARTNVTERVKDLQIEGKTKIRYTLQSGDVLGFIAEEYDVQVEDLKYWNNIYNERRIQAGQKLDIFVDDDKADYYRALQKTTVASAASASIPAQTFEIPASAKRIEHVVKNGESPYVIAKKYEGVSPEAILFWNGITDARKIQIGQKLILYLSQ